eukprot:Nk52_evm51s223 gene=Nk52_evmTU51s223
MSLSSSSATSAIAQANNAFSQSLYAELCRSNTSGNLIASPFSVSAVFAMAVLGAQENTHKEIMEVLFRGVPDESGVEKGYMEALGSLKVTGGAGEEESRGYVLKSANALYAQKDFPLLDAFVSACEKSFGAPVEAVNFGDNQATAALINKWVEQQTESRIKDLISPSMLNALTRVVLVNAVYFKGLWDRQFNPQFTEKEPFHVSDSQVVDCEMMHMKAKFHAGPLKDIKANGLAMPFKGGRLSMVFILPEETSSIGDGLAEVESLMLKTNLVDAISSIQEQPEREYEIGIPKFKMESSMELTDTLKALGVRDIFSDREADLSRVTSGERLYASAVVQKVFIEVNEKGGEAAAATGMIMMTRCLPVRPQQFRCDRPFVFIIHDQVTGMVLFMGKVTKPALE